MNNFATAAMQSFNKLKPAGAKVVVGLSGGVDSVVLAHLLSRLRPDLQLIAAHFNHKIRPEADDDERFCAEFATEYGMVFHSHHCNVPALASTRRLGVEEAARHARHMFLKEVHEREACDIIALGHHADDRVETLMLNLMRGTGVHGLGAMREQGASIVRPLLGFKKKDVLAYAEVAGLAWAEDGSNADQAYDRNWVRHSLIPQIEQRRPGFVGVVARAASTFELVSDYMRSEARQFLDRGFRLNVRSPDRSVLFEFEDYLSRHPALHPEIARMLWADFYGSAHGFRETVFKELDRWIRSEPANGSATNFGPAVRLVNRLGGIGYSANPELCRRLLTKRGQEAASVTFPDVHTSGLAP